MPTAMPTRRRCARFVALLAALLAIVGGLLGGLVGQPLSPASARASGPRIFAYYYLWWSTQHWHDKLGPSYPYNANPLPLPATVDADGCNPVSRYPGNQLTDVPATLESQDDPANLEKDVRQAAAAGLAGFVVNWIGTGSSNQTPTSITYSQRLDALVHIVHKVNAEGIRFTLLLSLKASDTVLSSSHLINDLRYLQRMYGADSTIDHAYTPRLPVIWTGSRKYATSTLATVSGAVRSKVALLGDETYKTWSSSRAAYLDGDHYYWSSQDPYRNPQSFSQLRTLASMVRSSVRNPDGSQKIWLAPLNPGYDGTLLYGTSTCVPRKGGQTLRDVYAGNATSNPDGYTLISWNEISEATYIKPMQRYGTLFTDTVRSIVSGG